MTAPNPALVDADATDVSASASAESTNAPQQTATLFSAPAGTFGAVRSGAPWGGGFNPPPPSSTYTAPDRHFHWEQPEVLNGETSGLAKDSNMFGPFDGIVADVKDRYKPEGRIQLTTDQLPRKIQNFGFSFNPSSYSTILGAMWKCEESGYAGGLRWTLEMTRHDHDRMRVQLRCEGADGRPDQGWSCGASAALRVHAHNRSGCAKDLVMDALGERTLYASRQAETSRFQWFLPLQTLWNSQHGLIENNTIKISARIAVKDVIGARSGIDVVAEEILAEVRQQFSQPSRRLYLNELERGENCGSDQRNLKDLLQGLTVGQSQTNSIEKFQKPEANTEVGRKLESLEKLMAGLLGTGLVGGARGPGACNHLKKPSEADSRETVERIAKLRAETRLINAQADVAELDVEKKRQQKCAPYPNKPPSTNVFC